MHTVDIPQPHQNVSADEGNRHVLQEALDAPPNVVVGQRPGLAVHHGGVKDHVVQEDLNPKAREVLLVEGLVRQHLQLRELR